jgi:hypothetical protein
MKTIIAALTSIVSLASVLNASVTITNFDVAEAIASDSPWSWTQGSKTLTITNNTDAGSLYPENPSTVNILDNTKLKITLASLITSNPGGGFVVTLQGGAGPNDIATAQFTWDSFTSGQPGAAVENEATLSTFGSFNPANVSGWNIADGGNGGSGSLSGASFVSLQAVPEPSTYALMALGGLVLFFMVRRRKVQA